MIKIFTVFSILLMLLSLSVYAQRDEETAQAIWTFDEGDATDTSGKNVNGTFVGDPEVVDGIVGKAVKFDGIDDGVKLPDSNGLNTGGPFTNRTITAFFNCSDVSITDHKQTIFEEGGRTRGLVLYVIGDKVYVGAWNRAEYQWAGHGPPLTLNLTDGIMSPWYYETELMKCKMTFLKCG